MDGTAPEGQRRHEAECKDVLHGYFPKTRGPSTGSSIGALGGAIGVELVVGAAVVWGVAVTAGLGADASAYGSSTTPRGICLGAICGTAGAWLGVGTGAASTEPAALVNDGAWLSTDGGAVGVGAADTVAAAAVGVTTDAAPRGPVSGVRSARAPRTTTSTNVANPTTAAILLCPPDFTPADFTLGPGSSSAVGSS